jgi:hypothetical protein
MHHHERERTPSLISAKCVVVLPAQNHEVLWLDSAVQQQYISVHCRVARGWPSSSSLAMTD